MAVVIAVMAIAVEAFLAVDAQGMAKTSHAAVAVMAAALAGVEA